MKVGFPMGNALKLGIAGLGTVGLGTLKILLQNAEVISSRAGKPIVVTSVSAKNRDVDRGISLDSFEWFDDPCEMAASENIDLVVEVIGGEDGIAKKLCEVALKSGKHLVTANKALIAHHGDTLALHAKDTNKELSFEAAVAGSVPIIKILREGVVGSRIHKIFGILNGTCNYILTEMRDTGRSFDDVLNEAKELGYAENDPTLDINGTDAAHKLSILASLAFGTKLNFNAVKIEGISEIAALDIGFAKELGYGIKLLGVASFENGVMEQRVQPCMVLNKSPINKVEGAFNAVVINGEFFDSLFLEGRGAGAGPTASAVVSDIVDIARGRGAPPFGIEIDDLQETDILLQRELEGAYYVRLPVIDKPGVLAEIAAILRDKGVSIESVIQRGQTSNDIVNIVMTLHNTQEKLMCEALRGIENLSSVTEKAKVFRIENF